MAKRKRPERPHSLKRRDALQGKRPPGRPPGRPATGKNEMIAIRWPRELLDGIDLYAQNQCLARPVALRQIVTKFLADQGIININSMFPANA